MKYKKVLKIGELAKLTGVSVRTLHYYDQIHLLKPSSHSSKGYRLYTQQDVIQLQIIRTLQQLGVSLTQIQHILTTQYSVTDILEKQLYILKEQIKKEKTLVQELEQFISYLRMGEPIHIKQSLTILKHMKDVEKYYTKEQLEELQDRWNQVGPQRIEEVEQEWTQLFEDITTCMQDGVDPLDAKVMALAEKWQSLINEFTGGNKEIEQSLNTMYANESEMKHSYMPDPKIGAYIQPALEKIKK